MSKEPYDDGIHLKLGACFICVKFCDTYNSHTEKLMFNWKLIAQCAPSYWGFCVWTLSKHFWISSLDMNAFWTHCIWDTLDM